MTPTAEPIPALKAGRAYAAGIALAIAIALLLVWTTIVHDDGGGAAVFMVILAAGVGAFAARFEPGAMARAMAGVAGMQLLLGLLVATAPVTASAPGGAAGALAYHGVFAALWLTAAACFRAARR